MQSNKFLTPPGPRSRSWLGSLPDLSRDRLGFLLNSAQQYGDVVKYRMASYRLMQVSHPAWVTECSARRPPYAYFPYLIRRRLKSGVVIFTTDFARHQEMSDSVCVTRKARAAFGGGPRMCIGNSLALMEAHE